MEKIGIEITNDSFTHQDLFARKHKRNYHNRENFLMKGINNSVTLENQKTEERGRVLEVSRPIDCC